MNIKNMISKVLNIAIVVFSFAMLFSCRKDNDTPSGSGNTFRYTVTINNVDSSDFVSFALAGSTKDINDTTVWKMNGNTLTAQQGIGLSATEFSGGTKTYVIESLKPLSTVSTGVQFINYGAAMSFSLKIEKNGTTVVNESQTLSGDGANFTKQYNF